MRLANQTLVDTRTTGKFSELINKYVDGSEELKQFVSALPSAESFVDVPDFSSETRKTVSQALLDQYCGVAPVNNKVIDNIKLLSQDNSYCIVTGHQLSLFTGPLYVIYKIAHVISICNRLNLDNTGKKYIPVFWLASEDHDIEEIRHVTINSTRYSAEISSEGPSGRITTSEVSSIVEKVSSVLGESHNADEIKAFIQRSYSETDSLGKATLNLINFLFGDEGLVIIEPDNPGLKALFKDEMIRDIVERKNTAHVKDAADKLNVLGYKVQANPRDINLFYIQHGSRNRIVFEEGYYIVLNTELKFTESELLNELNVHPESFSPNVILRPLYQQKILPSLCYVGGPGELAYWLELKSMFDYNKVHFPLLMLRRSIIWITPQWRQKLKKVNGEVNDLWMGRDSFLKKTLLSEGISVESTKVDITQAFEKLRSIAESVDTTLTASVDAELKKTLNGIDHLQIKLLKASKQKNEVFVKHCDSLFQHFFPGGSLEERTENFISYYLQYGKEFLKIIMKDPDPFKQGVLINEINDHNISSD